MQAKADKVGQGSRRTLEPRSKEVKFYLVAHCLLLNAQARECTSVLFDYLKNYDDFICLLYFPNEKSRLGSHTILLIYVYYSVTCRLYTQLVTDHCNCSTHKVSYILASRFLVTDPNNVLCLRPYRLANIPQLIHCSNCRFQSSPPYCYWPFLVPGFGTHDHIFLLSRLLRLHSQLTVLVIISRHGPYRKHRYSLAVQLFPWEHVYLWSRYLLTALAYLLISQSLPNNGYTCYSIIYVGPLPDVSFMVHLTTPLVPQTVLRLTAGWLTNDELKGIWNEAVVA
jgi:hypothetical protein